MPAYRYLVHGRVQGVGYRYFAMRTALSLKLTGFARNLSSGAVEVVAEGPGDGLAELEARLNSGPAFAEVSHVERSAIEPRGDEGFHIR
jgi:acylphosphatase